MLRFVQTMDYFRMKYHSSEFRIRGSLPSRSHTRHYHTEATYHQHLIVTVESKYSFETLVLIDHCTTTFITSNAKVRKLPSVLRCQLLRWQNCLIGKVTRLSTWWPKNPVSCSAPGRNESYSSCPKRTDRPVLWHFQSRIQRETGARSPG